MNDRCFFSCIICKDGREISQVETYLQLEQSRGAIRRPPSEDLHSLLKIVKILQRKSSDESWEILNPQVVGEVIEFNIKKIQKDYVNS
jgi:hypothetical protein